MVIQVSERAKDELTRMGVGNEKFLRISVVSGGCSGHTYSAAIDDAVGEDDKVVYDDDDFRAIANLQSAVLLHGLHVDYSADLVRSGFLFKNPNAVKACGCGASFQL